MASLLITGFTPFGKDTINPSGLVAERLGGIALPVAAEDALALTLEAKESRQCDFVLALGVAGGRPAICVESRALNEAEYPIPDHNGNLYQGAIETQSDAPPLLATPLDTLEIARAALRSGVPAYVSQDAGRYVCNHFYFRLLQLFPERCLFVHVPRLPEVEAAHEGAGPTMALETTERGVRAIVKYLTEKYQLSVE